MDDLICPECEQGKCINCTIEILDPNDNLVYCMCDCTSELRK